MDIPGLRLPPIFRLSDTMTFDLADDETNALTSDAAALNAQGRNETLVGSV